jgi:hypothetical protein
MTQSSRFIYAVSFLLAAAGFILSLWPLSVLGVALAALSGRWISAVLIGLLLDIAWGAPTGMYRYLFFPFTLLALMGFMLSHFGGRYFLDRHRQERL